MEKQMTAEELNTYAINKVKSLNEHKYFEIIRQVDKAIGMNKEPFDKGFYLRQQDILAEPYGEIIIDYRKLKGKLLSYVSWRKFQKAIEAETNKTKLPGDAILTDIAQSEVLDLFNAVLLLKGWIERGQNSIRSCRAHTYGDNEQDPEDRMDKEPEN